MDQLCDRFKKAVDFFGGQSTLEKEAALLSRCIYRMKMKFRSDKGLKSMEKLNRALLQYKTLKFHVVLSDFLSILLDEGNESSYLPTRNMLDYILVRLQGIVCLMCRAAEAAVTSADSMGSRICIGQFWKIALIMLGIVSRIWLICRDIAKESCQLYKDIKPMRNMLINIGSEWLPNNYIFPDNLEEWVDIDWVDIKAKFKFKFNKAELPILEIIESSDIEECGEYIDITDENRTINLINDDNEQEVTKSTETSTMFQLLTQNEDLGEVIDNFSIKQVKNMIVTSDSEDDNAVILKDFATTRTVTTKNDLAEELKESNVKTAAVKKKKKKKKKSVEGIHDSRNQIGQKYIEKKKEETLAEKIDNIGSLKELKLFMATLSKGNTSTTGLKKVNKLQLSMINKHVAKIMNRVKKKILSDSECITEAKTILRTNFT